MEQVRVRAHEVREGTEERARWTEEPAVGTEQVRARALEVRVRTEQVRVFPLQGHARTLFSALTIPWRDGSIPWWALPSRKRVLAIPWREGTFPLQGGIAHLGDGTFPTKGPYDPGEGRYLPSRG